MFKLKYIIFLLFYTCIQYNTIGQTLFQDILTPLGGNFDKKNKDRFVP
jgi:hypothetical protein